MSGTNAIAQRTPTTATAGIGTTGTTTSTTYTSSVSGGFTATPSITLTTGVKALVAYSNRHTTSVSTVNTWTSVAVSGASSITASDNWGASWDGTQQHYFGLTYLETALAAGSNTFTVQVRIGGAATMTTGTMRLSIVAF